MNTLYEQDIIIENESLRLVVGANGITKSLICKESGEECLAQDEEISLFSVTQERPFNNENKLIYMNRRTDYQANQVRKEGDRLIIGFETAPYEAIIKLKEAPDYIGFTLEKFVVKPGGYGVVAGSNDCALNMDVPPAVSFRLLQLPVKNREHFGEWLNVCWDKKAGVCVLATSPYAHIDSQKCKGYRILTADAIKGIKLEGCGAALITSTGDRIMDCVESIEEDYDLPRGVASRRSEDIRASIYWTRTTTPENVEEDIAYAKKGGFTKMLLYYSCFCKEEDGYKHSGDYDLRDEYPDGLSDIKAMLDKIRAAGITPGIHFLHSHIGMRSRYVTPIADHRLNLTRQFTLAKEIGTEDTVLYVEENPEGTVMHKDCRILQFHGELIYYDGYTTTTPYCFTGCKRGYNDTYVEAHAKGTRGGILDVSEFGATSVYLNQNSDLQEEVGRKLAAIYNCGCEFVYFDGSEGTNVPFDFHVPNAQYRIWKLLDKKPLFCEGAAKAHFGWHHLSGANAFDIYQTYEFKDRISEFPVKAAEYLRNDFNRVNFGWWAFYQDTQPDIYEFGISRAHAWDCPITMMNNRELFRKNPRTDDVLEVLRRWEDIRAKHWLTEEQKNAMKGRNPEFTLLINEKDEYELVQCEQIADAAGGDPNFRAFCFERDCRQYISCWHTTGEGRLMLPLAKDQIVYEEEIGKEQIAIETADDYVIIPVAGKRYLSTTLLKEELLTAVKAAKLIG